MIGYVHIAPSLPDEDAQLAAIGEVDALYRDVNNKRNERVQMIEDVQKRRPDETIRIATAHVLGVGRDLTATLRKLKGMKVHVCDTGETLPITAEVKSVLSFAARAQRMSDSGRTVAATKRAGRKPVTTTEQDNEIIRLHKLGVSLEKIAADVGVKYMTAWRRVRQYRAD